MKHDNLVIDVGMHTGEDTALYLAKDFDVVAIEANPALVERAKVAFADAIDTGRLRIYEAAIAEQAGSARLAVANDMTIWSSLSPAFIQRNEARGTRYRYVEVPAVSFESVVAEVGIPHYLKVDIEGLDMLCVRALQGFDERPDFVSIESNVSSIDGSAEAVFDELAHLWTLGYRGFKYLNQRANPRHRCPFPPREGSYVDARFTTDSSGPFGNETPGSWLSIEAALLRAQLIRRHHMYGEWSRAMPSRIYRFVRGRMLGRPPAWYDLHARLGP